MEYVEPKGLELKSLAGVIYTEPNIYASYSDKFLDDNIFKILISIYEKGLFDIEFRRKIINLLDSFFEGKLPKESLRNKLKKLEKEIYPFTLNPPENEGKISTSKILKLKESGDKFYKVFRKIVSVDVEGSDYVFSEGIKFKALINTIELVKEVIPYVEDYLNSVWELEPYFGGKLLHTLSDIISKTFIVLPEFLEVSDNEVLYSLKFANLNPELKAQKIIEKYPQVISNLKREYGKASFDKKQKLEKVINAYLKNRQRLENFYRYGDYTKLVGFYLILKVHRTLYLNDIWNEELKDLVVNHIRNLVENWRKQILDFKKVKSYLEEKGERIGEGNKIADFRIDLLENLGKILVFEKLNANRLKWLFNFEKLPYEKLIFHKLETLGELIDIAMVSYTLNKITDSVILSIPENYGDLPYKRLKVILNLFINNQTITERGYKSLRFGKDNLLRSLQKLRRKGEVKISQDLNLKVLIFIETHPSNRIAEVSKEDFDRENEKTAHRLFRVIYLYPKEKSIGIETLGFVGLLAGDFETAEMVKSVKELPKADHILFITTTSLGESSIKKLFSRLFNGQIPKFTLLNLEDINFIVNQPLNIDEAIVEKKENKLTFLKPIPKGIINRTLNETGLQYKVLNRGGDIDNETLIKILTILHLYFSDNKNFPFANLKLSKQRLGYIDLKDRKIAFSIALIETYLRLNRI